MNRNRILIIILIIIIAGLSTYLIVRDKNEDQEVSKYLTTGVEEEIYNFSDKYKVTAVCLETKNENERYSYKCDYKIGDYKVALSSTYMEDVYRQTKAKLISIIESYKKDARYLITKVDDVDYLIAYDWEHFKYYLYNNKDKKVVDTYDFTHIQTGMFIKDKTCNSKNHDECAGINQTCVPNGYRETEQVEMKDDALYIYEENEKTKKVSYKKLTVKDNKFKAEVLKTYSFGDLSSKKDILFGLCA